MLKRQSFFAAAVALLLGCGVELDLENSAPPGTPPSDSTAAVADSGSGGATPPADTTPPAVTPPGTTPPPTTTPPPGTTPPPTTPPGTTPPPGPVATATIHTVTLSNMAYSAATTTIKVGDTVTWKNVDSMDHTATSDAAGLFNGTLAQGKSFSFTFTKAGSFPYHCEKHKSTMKATVVVQ
jgi:plastocyanin